MPEEPIKPNAQFEDNNQNEEQPQIKISIFNELYIDILGSLVPGLFTVILGAGILILTASALYCIMFSQNFSLTDILNEPKGILIQIHYEIAIITLVASYVIGTAFFRQDPKRPDSLSALYVWATAKAKDRPTLSVQQENVNIINDANNCPSINISRIDKYLGIIFPHLYFKRKEKDFDAQFPYLNMRCYLAGRGLTHLVKYIPWCPNDSITKGYRTKMYINILKIRLSALGSRFSRDIVRNEAHVRLATSVWYASLILFRLGLICLVILIALIVYDHEKDKLKYYFTPASFTIVITSLCAVMKYHLRKCIHYMRVREVVYVIESTHLACQMKPEFRIDELIGVKEETKCAKCPRLMTKQQ